MPIFRPSPSRRRRKATPEEEEEEEEERSLFVDLKRHPQLAVGWSRHGSLIPRWT